MTRMRQGVIAGLLSVLTLTQPTHAQLSGRQITIVVPIGAGGGVDATGRLVAEKLQERLKQPVIVENRPAGGGMVGTDSVAKAAPDGHTLLLIETSATLHNGCIRMCRMTWSPISRRSRVLRPRRCCCSPIRASGPTTPKELIALARAEPGKISAGTPGVGTPHHLALMMLNALAKIEIVNVPYRGAALVLNDVLANQIPIGWAAPTALMPHVASGKIKLIGVASGQRDPSLPKVPPIAEGGLPGFDLDIWFGVAAPAKTPPDVVARLNREIAAIIALPDVQDRIRKVGLSPAYEDGAKFSAQIRADHERFGKIIRDAGIVPN